MACPDCGAPKAYQRETGGDCWCCGADYITQECPTCGGDRYVNPVTTAIDCPRCDSKEKVT